MDLDAPAKQVEFAQLVGASQPAISKHMEAGTLEKGATYREWIRSYCDRLRDEAAGRIVSDARERRDMAQARQAEADAALKERELWKADGELLEYDGVRQMMIGWTVVAKNELVNAMSKLVRAVESKHGITIERELYQPHIDDAARAIGSHADEFEASSGGDKAGMATAGDQASS